ncbi:hypothetical protein C8Q74DRAFT_1221780 [Fomes fomentarius]|nr:hypothetical protein C8Q74DRAFT_1221780 [Fomes fomentarius]
MASEYVGVRIYAKITQGTWWGSRQYTAHTRVGPIATKHTAVTLLWPLTLLEHGKRVDRDAYHVAAGLEFLQDLDSSVSSLAADRAGLSCPRRPDTEASQTDAAREPLRATRTLRKEGTLTYWRACVRSPRPRPAASKVVANEVFVQLERRIRNLFIEMHNSDRDILIHYAHSLTESIRLQLTEEMSELSRLEMEILGLHMQVQSMRPGP